MIKNYSNEKLYNAMTYFIENTNHCDKKKLFKLLYYLDFQHFKETGRSVTNLKYFTWPQGPAPSILYDRIEDHADEIHKEFNIKRKPSGGEDIHIIFPLKPFDGKYFTKREMKILKDLSTKHKNEHAWKMVDITHETGEPWSITVEESGMNKEINYFLAVDEENSHFTKNEIEENEKDRERLFEIFSK